MEHPVAVVAGALAEVANSQSSSSTRTSSSSSEGTTWSTNRSPGQPMRTVIAW